MRTINVAEAVADLEELSEADDDTFAIDGKYLGALGIQLVTMMLSKLLHRSTSDEIYDELNSQLENMTSDDLKDFQVVEEYENIECALPDKVMKNTKGVRALYYMIKWRVTGYEGPFTEEEQEQAGNDISDLLDARMNEEFGLDSAFSTMVENEFD